jgi:hypothetical protein
MGCSEGRLIFNLGDEAVTRASYCSIERSHKKHIISFD